MSKKKILFHKKNLKPYYCFIALLDWMTDFHIVYISISIIFISLFSLNLYYQNFQNGNIGQIRISLLLLPTILTMLYLWYVSHTKEQLKRYYNKGVQIFFILVLLSFRILAVISNDLDKYHKSLSFTGGVGVYQVDILDISRNKGSKQTVKFNFGKISVIGYVDWFEKISIGDSCQIEGEILRPKNFDDFDYVRYLQNKNIYGVVNRVQILECNKNSRISFLKIKGWLYSLRDFLSQKIERNLPEPQASLLIGILFGSSRAFDDEFDQYLRVSGTTHIISASGYNVSVLVLLSNKLFGFLNKKWRSVFSLLLIWMFAIFAGFSGSIVRAAIIGSLTISSTIMGKTKMVHTNLALAVGLFVFASPKVVFDIGFQLSVMATLGLVYILPSIQNIVKSKIFGENVLSTIGCTISTLPITISVFKKVSLVSIFANSLVLPLTQSTMLYGFIALISSIFQLPTTSFLFSIPYVQLKLFQIIVEGIGSVSWGYMDVDSKVVSIFISIVVLLFCSYFYPVDRDDYYMRKRYEY